MALPAPTLRLVLANDCAAYFGTVPDCLCPYEHWHINGVCLDVHVEEDGSLHMHLDAGDWEQDARIEDVKDMDEARELAIEWAMGFLHD